MTANDSTHMQPRNAPGNLRFEQIFRCWAESGMPNFRLTAFALQHSQGELIVFLWSCSGPTGPPAISSDEVQSIMAVTMNLRLYFFLYFSKHGGVDPLLGHCLKDFLKFCRSSAQPNHQHLFQPSMHYRQESLLHVLPSKHVYAKHLRNTGILPSPYFHTYGHSFCETPPL